MLQALEDIWPTPNNSFWKATVHSWRGGETDSLIDLGAFTEPIRKYLRNEGPFPAQMVLMIGVLPAPVKHIAFTVPYQGSSQTWNNFIFYVLGMEFTILAGNSLGEEQMEASFTGNPAHPILLFNFERLL